MNGINSRSLIIIKALVIIFFTVVDSSQLVASTIGMQAKTLNFNSFPSQPIQFDSEELIKITPNKLREHPEFGILPHNTQCSDCIELIQERTTYSRMFLKRNSNGKVKYIQKAYDPLHYMDINGNLRSIDERLRPHPIHKNVYYAPHQEGVTEVDLNQKNIKIRLGNDVLIYNQDLQLISVNSKGEENIISNANWSKINIGEDGFIVLNIFPGIDMEVLALRGAFKTNFLIQNKNFIPGGANQIIIRDNVTLPEGHTIKSLNNEKNITSLFIVDASGNSKFTFHEIIGVEKVGQNRKSDYFNYALNNNLLDIVIPADWLYNANNFPLYIDPLVTSTGTLPQASIAGSGLNNSGTWTNSCDYRLNVTTPANSTITDILWTFTYIAQNGVPKSDGALTILLGNCRSPANNSFYWTCQDPIFGGACSGSGISIFNDLSACVRPPQCTPYNLDFTMNFYDAFGGATCSNIFIGANSDWIMTVEARTIEHPSPITSTNGSSICLGESTTLNAQGSFGVPPYTYVWTPGNLNGASVNVSPTSTTNYSVSVRDACNIQATQVFTVNVSGPTAPVVTGNSPLCVGEDIVLTATSTGATSYSWSGPNSFSSNQQNPTVTNASTVNSGTYNVEASGSGCTTAPVTVAITVNPNPVITNIDTIPAPCGGNNGSAEITAGSGSSPYIFDLGNGLNNNTGIFPTLPIGIYNLTVTDDNGCETFAAFEIYSDACCAMTNTTASTPISCNGACDGTITLTETDGVAPVQFSIDSGATLQNNGNFNNLCAGIYDIIIVDADSCFYVNQVVLADPPALSFQSVTIHSDCGACNGNITINASGGTGSNYSYSIDNGANFQSSNTFPNLCPDNYSVVVQDVMNCSDNANVLIETINFLNIQATSTDSDCGTCNGSITINASGGTGSNYSYSIDNGVSFQSANTFTNLCPNNYNVVVETGVNCSDNTSVLIETINFLNIQATSINSDCGVCNGSITITASGGSGGNYSYSIDNGVNFQPSNTFLNLCPNNYDVVVEIGVDCSENTQILVEEENNSVVLTTNATPISCNSANDGEIEAIASSNNLPITYEWNTNSTDSTLTGLAPGTYTVTVIDQRNCSRSDTVELIDPLPLVVDLGNDQSLCFGEAAIIGPGNYSSYLWSTGDSIASIEVVESGNYSVTAEDQSGCEGSDEVEITTIDEVNLNAGNDTTIESFQNLQLQAEVNGSNNTSGNISWSPSDFLSCDDCFDPIANLSESQEYIVSYSDPNGCKAIDTILITVEDGEYYVYLPTAFSPNGDGLNDIYKPVYSGVDTWVLRIYNRWGEKVFESRDFDELWDGSYNGNILPSGVYVYHMYAEFLNLSTHRSEGSLTLIR